MNRTSHQEDEQVTAHWILAELVLDKGLQTDEPFGVFPAAMHNAARIAWPAPVHGEASLRPEAHRQWRGGPGGP